MNKPNYIKVKDVTATATACTLDTAIKEAIALAKELGGTVTFTFNGIPICVDEWDDIEVTGFRYDRAAARSKMERV